MKDGMRRVVAICGALVVCASAQVSTAAEDKKEDKKLVVVTRSTHLPTGKSVTREMPPGFYRLTEPLTVEQCNEQMKKAFEVAKGRIPPNLKIEVHCEER